MNAARAQGPIQARFAPATQPLSLCSRPKARPEFVDEFERCAPEAKWWSAPKARMDQRVLFSTVSPSLLGVMAGVPNELVNATVLSMAAELGREEDQAALREADRVPEAIVCESTGHELRWVFARSRRVVARTTR